MSVNILADFKENGADKNRPHIVCGTNNVHLAAMKVKDGLEKQGYVVQALTVVDGYWTLDQLHDMANYGMYLDQVNARVVYVSKEEMEWVEELKQCPKKRAELNQEIKRRRAAGKRMKERRMMEDERKCFM